MGFMYWVFNDIWEAPSASTIDYSLRWKMGHYYVRSMFQSVYPIASLTPYLANVDDQTAQISFDVVNDLHQNIHGDLQCGIYTLDTFIPRHTFEEKFSFTGPGIERVLSMQYSLLIKRANCTNETQCIINCVLPFTPIPTEQTLFLFRPKTYRLQNPNLKIISVTVVVDNVFNIFISASRPALFVWIDIPANVTGYFSKNGFHMFQPSINFSFHSSTTISALHLQSIISLYDITQL